MMTIDPDWLRPPWQLPRVGALMTTRAGGTSAGGFRGLNLRDLPGDEPAAVAAHRARLAAAIGATPVWLDQVHGVGVARLTGADAAAGATPPTADASVTSEPGIACSVLVADCLPVLFAAAAGRAVAAAHAGWRGLAAGVLEATLAAVSAAGRCEPAEVQVWLGACIGPRRFEVGPDVLAAFGVDPRHGEAARESVDEHPRFVAHGPGKWLADLPQLARDRLHAAGARHVSGGSWCTVEDPSRFFSYRRDRITGRMAAVVWIDSGR